MEAGRMSQLPHVIWDMGGIFYRYFTQLMVDVAEERGWPLDRIPIGPTGQLPDPDYQRMLDGDLDEPDYLVVIRARLEAEGIDFDPPTELVWLGEARAETWAGTSPGPAHQRCFEVARRELVGDLGTKGMVRRHRRRGHRWSAQAVS
jgi:hypothetical protein